MVVKRGVKTIVDVSLTGAALNILGSSNVPLRGGISTVLAAGLMAREAKRSKLLKKKYI